MPRILLASLLIGVVAAAQQTDTPPPPNKTPPRDARATSEPQAAAIAALKTRFENTKVTVSEVLADPEFLDLHDQTPFRRLIAERATTQPVTMVTKTEPGTPLIVLGRVTRTDGKGVADALVYAYHTDARGFYGYERAHVGGNEGDFRHARLFAYVRTDADGRFELRTIRPAGYPDAELPQHIHFEISAKDFTTRVTEVLFADDPRLNPVQRQHAQRARAPVVDVTVETGRPARCEVVLELPPKT